MIINAGTQFINAVSLIKLPQKANNISFKNMQKSPLTKEDYKRAQEYCEKRCAELKNMDIWSHKHKLSLVNNFDLEKLNGLQYGIELFESNGRYDGMTMKEIAYTLGDLSVLLNRGCKNNCSHCYINALPKSKLSGTTSFTYEDFKKLLAGISELKSRVEKNGVELVLPEIRTLFNDSDCIDIEISDKKGKKYDIVDCFDLIRQYPNLKTTGLFDTSGWNTCSEVHQKRGKKLVKYILDTYNDKSIKNKPVQTVLVSINPFHSLYQKYINLKDKRPGEASVYKDLYINRIANTLYTFSPLLDVKDFKLTTNITVLNSNPNYDDKVMNGLIDEILSKLGKLYDTKGVSKELKEHYLEEYNNNMRKPLRISNALFRPIEPYGRAKNIIPANELIDTKEYGQQIKSLLLKPPYLNGAEKTVNPNGQIVILEKGLSFPTDIHLNLSQSNKSCPPLGEEIKGAIHPQDAEFKMSDTMYF